MRIHAVLPESKEIPVAVCLADLKQFTGEMYSIYRLRIGKFHTQISSDKSGPETNVQVSLIFCPGSPRGELTTTRLARTTGKHQRIFKIWQHLVQLQSLTRQDLNPGGS